MKRQRWFVLSTVGLVLLLFSLPTNSRADTIHEHQSGLFNSQGHGVGLLTATQKAAHGFAASAVFHFGGKEAKPGEMGELVGSETDAGRPLVGSSDRSGNNVWTGTSYVFGNGDEHHGDHNGDDNGNHNGDNNGHHGNNNGNKNNNSDHQGNGDDNNNSSVPVPEPATYLLLATGLVGLLVYHRVSDA